MYYFTYDIKNSKATSTYTKSNIFGHAEFITLKEFKVRGKSPWYLRG